MAHEREHLALRQHLGLQTAKTGQDVMRVVRSLPGREGPTDPVPFMQRYFEVEGINVRTEIVKYPNSNKVLILAPNHFSRRRVFTTQESWYALVLTTLAAKQACISTSHVAWFSLRLNSHRLERFDRKKFRETQNAAIKAFQWIPVELNGEGRLKNLGEMAGITKNASDSGQHIGYFPEQKPSHTLDRYHNAFPKFLKFMQLLDHPIQIIPTSIHFEGKTGHATFGCPIDFNTDTDINITARCTMIEIARNLPSKLRGHYKKAASSTTIGR